MIRKNTGIIIMVIAAILLISLESCDPTKKLEKAENDKIQEYLGNNSNLDFVLKPSGLYYLELVAGIGVSPVKTDSAYVRYTGKFLNGQIFDSNVSSGVLYGFIVGQNITGFDEGVTLMKAGGKATVLVPSELGYGTRGSPPYISGYTPLLFDIELVKVVPNTGK